MSFTKNLFQWANNDQLIKVGSNNVLISVAKFLAKIYVSS